VAQVLELLHDHGGLAQRELMQEMNVDPSILVTLLNRSKLTDWCPASAIPLIAAATW
jgi:hypothetical protein